MTDVLDLERGRLSRLRLAHAAPPSGPPRATTPRRSPSTTTGRPSSSCRGSSAGARTRTASTRRPTTIRARRRRARCSTRSTALGLRPGMRVLDMGAGWGCFVEYAGRQGIRVEAITISHEQHRFVAELIARERLPCTVTLVDLFAYHPAEPFDGAVFMGTLEHVPEVRARGRLPRAPPRAVGPRVRRLLRPALAIPHGRVPAEVHLAGTDRLRRPRAAWCAPSPAPASTSTTSATTRSATHTPSATGRAASRRTATRWRRSSARRRCGRSCVYLWASHHFLATNRTQAYHLVAGREPRRA